MGKNIENCIFDGRPQHELNPSFIQSSFSSQLEQPAAAMDVFLMIRRKKTTMFLDAKENTTVAELKKMIEGITKQPPNQQRLYNHDDTVSESAAHGSTYAYMT